MGYYIHTTQCNFLIKKKNEAGALKAIQALDPAKDGGGGGSYNGGKKETWFSWVTTSEYKNAKTLKEAITAWRWDVEENEKGEIEGLSFDSKSGDEEILFKAIAPYVERGSYIELQGEEGETYRYIFDGKTVQNRQSELDWDGKCDAFRAILEHKDILPTLLGIHPTLDKAIDLTMKKG